jgi:hypothetical protein
MTTYLIADTREKVITPFIEDEFIDHAFLVKQIPIGDYNICKGGQVLACVERKTLSDLAAGIQDGRSGNVDKMLDLRVRTGCQLYFCIEGPAFPAPKRKFGGIEYYKLRAYLDKLMTRHAIIQVLAEDERHVAVRLYQLTAALDDAVVYKFPCDRVETKEVAPAADGDTVLVPAEIMVRKTKTVQDMSADLWRSLKGVTLVTGRLIAKRFSPSALVRGKVPDSRLAAIKTATGRPIHKLALASLRAVRAGDAAACGRLLASIDGVSKTSAEHMLKASGGLAAICSYTVKTLALMRVPHGTKTQALGEARARRIYSVLHYTEAGGLADEPARPPVVSKIMVKAKGAGQIAVRTVVGTAAGTVVSTAVDAIVDTSADDTVDAPAGDTVDAPADDTIGALVVNTVDVPADNTVDTPVDVDKDDATTEITEDDLFAVLS